MAKKTEISIEEYLQNNLQAMLLSEFGKRHFDNAKLPDCYKTALNPTKKFRPYQEECLKYFDAYMDNELDFKEAQPHLLFHMATGSGKTLIMAALIIYLYDRGYRNFLFFVDNSNIIEKTKDNLLNVTSGKYLFANDIILHGKRVEIKSVDNFQDSDLDCINLCITTVQALHNDMNNPKEGALTYEDFANLNVVLIADEAHHINAATKRGKNNAQKELSGEGFDAADDWETTVMQIFKSGFSNKLPNMLLEFTATEDFYNPAIADKYRNKVIYDYPLKKFRQDKFSKDIDTVQADLDEMGRVLQAVILSQYRRKLFASLNQDIKPVVMLKSKKIEDNKRFLHEFIKAISSLKTADLEAVRPTTNNVISDAFNYFESHGITLENLVLEIREDFKEDNLLLVDGNNITPEKQKHLNSLESKDNEYRVVFAVDMLNEGWDVLNLFDIVRLYQTRDSGKGKIGKTTNQEAQLIGRGARYMPFKINGMEGMENVRKFDNQPDNPLRMLETLHYHCVQDPKYISDIRNALVQSGIISDNRKRVVERLKDSFKESYLYKHGYVFVNEQVPYIKNENITEFSDEILNMEFKVRLNTGVTTSNHLFGKGNEEVSAPNSRMMNLMELSEHVVRTAINQFEEYRFDKLHARLPSLASIKDFIESTGYLSGLRVSVYGNSERLANLTQIDKLYIAHEVLRQLEPMIAKGGIGYYGSKVFRPIDIKSIFTDNQLTFDAESSNGDKEFGKSMKTESKTEYRLNLEEISWYGYDDNYGTSEEKSLILYIRSIFDRLKEKYVEDAIYLLRNEKKLKLYTFEDGRAYEPDFVLFLRRKGSDVVFDNVQIFIEPKGKHLRKNDDWKEKALEQIHQEADLLNFRTATDEFEIWGMPFYGEDLKVKFDEELSKAILGNR